VPQHFPCHSGQPLDPAPISQCCYTSALYAYVKPNAGPFSLVQHSVPELSITILINHDQLDAYLVEDPVAKFSRIQGNTQPRQVSHSSSSSSKKKKHPTDLHFCRLLEASLAG